MEKEGGKKAIRPVINHKIVLISCILSRAASIRNTRGVSRNQVGVKRGRGALEVGKTVEGKQSVRRMRMLMGAFGAVITLKLQRTEKPQLALTLHHSSVHLQRCPVSCSDPSLGSSCPLLDSPRPPPPVQQPQRDARLLSYSGVPLHIFPHIDVCHVLLSDLHVDDVYVGKENKIHHSTTSTQRPSWGGGVALGFGVPQSSVLGRI